MKSSCKRYCQVIEFPKEAYIPGSGQQHPDAFISETLIQTAGKAWSENQLWLFGVDCFNFSYVWEAHEAWEHVWNAMGRTRAPALFVQGLIFLTAARLKKRQGKCFEKTHVLAQKKFSEAGDQSNFWGIQQRSWSDYLELEINALSNSEPLPVLELEAF